MALALKMTGTEAEKFGMSVEQTLALLSMMANQGIMGSDAGTSLKTFMMRLTAPTDEVKQVLNELGVAVYDLNGVMREPVAILGDLQQALYGVNEVTVTSSNLTNEQAGRMKYLEGQISRTKTALANYAAGFGPAVRQSEQDKIVAVDRLNRELAAQQAEYAKLAGVGGTTSTVMRQLTEEQRNAYMTTIWGTDGIRAASIVLPEFTESYEAAMAGVERTGIAAALAQAGMAGIAGAVEEFKGAVESTLIEVLLPYEAGMAALVRRGAELVASFTKLSPATQKWVLIIAVAAAAIGPLLVGVGTLMTFLGAALPVLAAIGGALAALLSPIGLVAAGLAVLFAMDVGGFRARAVRLFADLVKVAGQTTALLPVAGKAFREVIVQVTGLGSATFGTTDNLRGLISALGGSTDDMKQAEKILAGLRDRFGQVSAAIQALASGEVDFSSLASNLREQLNGIKLPNLSDVWNAAKLKITTLIQDVDWQVPAEQFQLLKTAVLDAISIIDWATLGEEQLTKLRTGIAALKTAVVGTIVGVEWAALAEEQADALKTKISGLKGAVLGAVLVVDWMPTEADLASLKTKVASLKDAIVAQITQIDWSVSPEQVANLQSLLSSVQPIIDQVFGPAGILATVNTSINEVITAVGNQLAGVDATALGEQFGGIIVGITTVSSLLMTANIAGTTERVAAIIGLGNDILTFLTEFGAGVNTEEIATAVGGFVSTIASTLTEKLQDPELINLGESLGGFVRMVITQIGNALAAPSLGEDMGSAAGETFAGLTTAATRILSGFANELAKVDWAEVRSQIQTFLGGFATGVAAAVGETDWMPVATALRDALGDALVEIIGGIFPQGILGEDPFFTNSMEDMLAQRDAQRRAIEQSGLSPEIQTAALQAQMTGFEQAIEQVKTALGEFAAWVLKNSVTASPLGALFGLNGQASDSLIPEFPGWEVLIKWPANISWPEAGFSNWIKWPANIIWPTTGFSNWIKWPEITWPGWDDFIRWPNIPSFPGWSSLWSFIAEKMGIGNGLVSSGSIGPGQQLGVSYWQGGGTWVGEGGREWVNLPRGSQVIPHREAEAMAGGGWGGPIADTIVVRSEADLYKLTYLIDDTRRRRQRRR
jgi:hypothetical protein